MGNGIPARRSEPVESATPSSAVQEKFKKLPLIEQFMLSGPIGDAPRKTFWLQSHPQIHTALLNEELPHYIPNFPAEMKEKLKSEPKYTLEQVNKMYHDETAGAVGFGGIPVPHVRRSEPAEPVEAEQQDQEITEATTELSDEDRQTLDAVYRWAAGKHAESDEAVEEEEAESESEEADLPSRAAVGEAATHTKKKLGLPKISESPRKKCDHKCTKDGATCTGVCLKDVVTLNLGDLIPCFVRCGEASKKCHAGVC